MIRNAFSICIAIGVLGLGACEKHSADTLPDHYKHKGKHNAQSDHKAAPEHSEKKEAPASGHAG